MTADYTELDAGIDYVQSAAYAGGKLYLAGSGYDEEDNDNRYLFLAVDPATGETSELTGYAPPAAPEGRRKHLHYRERHRRRPGVGLWVQENLNYYDYSSAPRA